MIYDPLDVRNSVSNKRQIWWRGVGGWGGVGGPDPPTWSCWFSIIYHRVRICRSRDVLSRRRVSGIGSITPGSLPVAAPSPPTKEKRNYMKFSLFQNFLCLSPFFLCRGEGAATCRLNSRMICLMEYRPRDPEGPTADFAHMNAHREIPIKPCPKFRTLDICMMISDSPTLTDSSSALLNCCK